MHSPRHPSLIFLVAFCAARAAILTRVCHGWSIGGGGGGRITSATTTRRQLLQHTMIAVPLTSTMTPTIAIASTAASTLDAGLQKMQMGHARVRYLLDHWDEVTTVCGTTVMTDLERRQVVRTEGGTQCVLTPLRVQEFMGYKSINDPLYKADKLMLSLLKYVHPDDVDKYLDYVEQYREKADQTAMLAYTSSWGEANPNGSKEQMEAYLDQTKIFVTESEKLLRSILGYLHLEPLPPIQGKL